MFGTFGRMLRKQLATFDPATSSWRMSGDTYLWDSGTYSGTWPPSGMTRNGVLYELQPPEHLTDENESSSLLPTVTASETSGAGRGPAKTGGDNLRTTVQLLRTPMAAEADGGLRNPSRLGSTQRLRDQIHEHLLPTPVASEGTKATNRQNAEQKAKTGQVWLTNIAHTIAQNGAGLNPPSGAGSASPGAQLPGQLSLLDAMDESA